MQVVKDSGLVCFKGVGGFYFLENFFIAISEGFAGIFKNEVWNDRLFVTSKWLVVVQGGFQ
jgi:hypothetical protein